jgi:hypothetical protein
MVFWHFCACTKLMSENTIAQMATDARQVFIFAESFKVVHGLDRLSESGGVFELSDLWKCFELLLAFAYLVQMSVIGFDSIL